MPGDGVELAYDWGIAGRALEGERASGDRSLVAPRGEGMLFAVVDGLGHGEEAEIAAREALDTIESHVEDDLPSLVERCHRALRRTRGAVMAVLTIQEDGRLHWTGVGNVTAVVVRKKGGAREHALLLGGVLGMQVPRVSATEVALQPGDAVVLATDGISASFLDDLVVGPPQRTADHILEHHASDRDDALVLVLRYVGGER